VTKGKIDKKIWGNESYLGSFESFFVLCQQKWTAVKKEDMRHEVRRVIYCGDNLYWMSRLPDEFVDLCYIDPPLYFPNVSVASK
jgi:hypothetical protein